jgi:predicted nucleic acid-binding protein
MDTNVLVYYFQSGDNSKKIIARKCIDENLPHAIISVQVLGELFNVLKKKGNDSLKCADIVNACMSNFNTFGIQKKLVAQALKINQQYGFSYYDSLIVASALEADCKILYTEDLQHNQLIEGRLRIINPFISE